MGSPMAVKHAQSPLAPKTTPTLPRIAGVKLAAAQSGVRYKDRDDVMLAVVPAGATIAGVLTRSKCSSAPVDWCRKNLARGKVRAIVVNAGNANAFTGKLGDKAVEETTRAIAQAMGCPRNEVFMASTGVIGQPLDWEKIAAVVPGLLKSAREDAWSAAAAAIMTTDTFPKLATRQAKVGERTVTINGFLKGSGMIAPDMATMLAFVFTDAKVPGAVLQKLLADAADKSLNCVTVDGASSNGAARKIGLSIANSPLVKTAIAGEDANWGRIVMAVGKSGERADRDKLRISIGGVKITDGGQVVPNYDETPVAKHIKGTDIVIDIDLGIGRGRATVWTCDLTHGYIDINGSYRS